MDVASDMKEKNSSYLQMEMHVGVLTLTVTSINQIVIQTDEKLKQGPQSPLGAQNQNQSSAQNRMWA